MSSEYRVQLQPAFLLHRKPYRDTSLIVELFTEDYGRVGVVAKGARNTRSRLKGILQPYHSLLVSWSGRGELVTLTGAESHGMTLFLQGDALVSGFYVNELLMRLLARHDPHPQLFASYSTTISSLAGGDNIDWTLRLFERDLLQELGYGLLLTHEGESGDEVVPQGLYHYDHEVGPRMVVNTEHSRKAFHGAALLALAAGQCEDTELRKECKWLMRDVLSNYIGKRPLASRELFRQKRVKNEEELH